MTESQLQAMDRTGETGEIIFRGAPGGAVGEQKIERCPCGYPMPCNRKVPVTFCRAVAGERA